MRSWTTRSLRALVVEGKTGHDAVRIDSEGLVARRVGVVRKLLRGGEQCRQRRLGGHDGFGWQTARAQAPAVLLPLGLISLADDAHQPIPMFASSRCAGSPSGIPMPRKSSCHNGRRLGGSRGAARHRSDRASPVAARLVDRSRTRLPPPGSFKAAGRHVGRPAGLKAGCHSSEIPMWTFRTLHRGTTRTSNRLRRTKLVAAVSVSALAGVGSFAATYHALVLMAEPQPSVGSVAPLTSGGTGTAQVDHPRGPATPMTGGPPRERVEPGSRTSRSYALGSPIGAGRRRCGDGTSRRRTNEQRRHVATVPGQEPGLDSDDLMIRRGRPTARRRRRAGHGVAVPIALPA